MVLRHRAELRRAVAIPDAWRGRRVLLHFQAVDYDATVWVNGKAVAPGTCGACHISDDVHDGRYGNRCERCHNTTNFKQIKPGVVY